MRAVVQRVNRSSLSVDGEKVSQIERGLTILVSVGKDDTFSDVRWIAQKVLNLRIFSQGGKMSQSVVNINGEILVVSQFTLHADVRKGTKPSFDKSASRELARSLINKLVKELKQNYSGKVAEGKFGEDMEIKLLLAGPVTIWLDSKNLDSKRSSTD